MRTVGIIPARYQSTRFPGKPLAPINGRPMIEHVWRRASRCRELDDIVIATDDARIRDAVRGFGARAVMTSPSCASGTDRLAEVARNAERRAGIFINIQGDEPLVAPTLIDRIARALKDDPELSSATAAYPLSAPEDLNNPNVVKVVFNRAGDALYFSRCLVPYPRDRAHARWFKHMGIYGYRRKLLLEFTSWKQTPLEKTELLEQLRILEHGHRMRVLIAKNDSIGVDTPDDVHRIEKALRK